MTRGSRRAGKNLVKGRQKVLWMCCNNLHSNKKMQNIHNPNKVCIGEQINLLTIALIIHVYHAKS